MQLLPLKFTFLYAYCTSSSFVISVVTGRKFTKFLRYVSELFLLSVHMSASLCLKSLWNTSSKNEGGICHILNLLQNLIEYHSNFPWAVTKQVSD